MRTRYRVVRDTYLGYEAQVRYWWWPFWMQMHKPGLCVNTWSSLEDAKDFIAERKAGIDRVVWQDAEEGPNT